MNKIRKTGRAHRWSARLSAGTAVLLVAAIAAIFRPVDRKDWSTSESMISAEEIVSTVPDELKAGKESPLRAGWAVAPLRTKIGEPLAGYAARESSPSIAGGESMWVRVLCLRTETAELFLVTADILLVHAGVAEEVAKQCEPHGVSPESIYYTATHTHGGPGGWGPNLIEEAVCGEYDPAIAMRIAEDLSNAILAAKDAAEPAEWTWLRTEAPQFVRNRTVKGGITDPTLEALCIRRASDHAVGLFAFYGAHATCLGPDQMSHHGDYPGVLVREIEKEGVAFAAFGSASVGSQSPVAKGSPEEKAHAIGSGLAEKLLTELKITNWKSKMHLATSRKTIPLPEFQIRVTGNIRLAKWIADGIHPTTAPIHFVRIDQHRIVGLPVEFSSLLSTPLRFEAKQAGLELTPTVFNGDYVGYVLPVEIYDSGAYETKMNFLGPGGGAWFSELIRVGLGGL